MRSFLAVFAFLLVALSLVAGLWLVGSGGERAEPRTRAEPSSAVPEPARVGEEALGIPAELHELAPESEARAPLPSGSAPPAPRARWAEDVARANRITGVVRQPDGSAAHYAHVRYVWDEGGGVREVRGRTGPDGRFELAIGESVSGDLLAYVEHHAHAPVARTGLASDAEDLELVLGPPEFLTLEVRDTRGVTLEDVQPRFSWVLAGHAVQDHPGGPGLQDGQIRWGRSPVPFHVSIAPHGYRGITVGPLDPLAVGARLRLEVEARARVRGRVRLGARPVPGAEVTLRSLTPAPAAPARATSCDADGRFELVQPGAGRYELLAYAAPHGEGVLAPLELDGVHDVDGLELELTRALGSIEGRVILPAGHSPDELWLFASSAEGYRGLRADGTFLLPDLRAGPCTVAVRASPRANEDETPGQRWIHPNYHPEAPEWLATEPIHTVEVRPGERVRLDIDLTGPAACRLVGSIRIDGRAPRLRYTSTEAHFRAEPQAVLDAGSRQNRQSVTDLDADGAFTLSSHGPGEYRLEIQLGLAGTPSEAWKVLDHVELRAGVVPWRLDVATGSLRIERSGTERLPGLVVLWKGPDGAEVHVQYPELDSAGGQASFAYVPAGRVRIVPRGAQGQAGLELDVRAGELTEARWPH